MLIFIDMWYTILHLSKPQNYIYIYVYSISDLCLTEWKLLSLFQFWYTLAQLSQQPRSTSVLMPSDSMKLDNFFPSNAAWCHWPMDARAPRVKPPMDQRVPACEWSFWVCMYVCLSVRLSVSMYVCVCHVCVNHLRRCKTSTSVFTCSFQAGDFISF